MNQIFPKEFIDTSVEHYTFRLRKQSISIYLILVISFIIILVSLPLIKIKVSVSAFGIITTPTNRYELSIPASGLLLNNHLKENLTVKEGDTLLVFDNSILQKEQNQIDSRLSELAGFSEDLRRLTGTNIKSIERLISSRFQIAFLKYQTELEQRNIEKEALKKVYKRQKKLFELNVISEVEFEKDEVNYERSCAEMEVFKKQAINNWKETFLSIEQERERLSLRKKELESERLRSVLIAPASGELLDVLPLKTNQFVAAGLKVGEITPVSDMMAICQVAPKDIGLIKKQMKALFLVDAFNPNEWGYLKGRVSAISSDTYLINSQPFFKVECQLEQDYLTLKNGVRGKLKKGMTVQTSFTVTERTLYQLIYDKVDDWLNPNRP